MKVLTPVFRTLDPSWSVGVSATRNAENAVRGAQKHLGKSSRALWRELAISLLKLESDLGSDPWFTAQTLHWFEGITAGDPRSHPELLSPIRYEFLAKWVPDAVVIGTSEDFRLPRSYMSSRLLNELQAEYRDSEPSNDLRK